MDKKTKSYGIMVTVASFMAFFVFFGYRSAFSVLLTPMRTDLGWDAAQVTAGYSIMMVIYAITAYFSGVVFSKFGPKFCFGISAIAAFLGYFVTSYAQTYYAYLIPYALFAGIATGMVFVPAVSAVRSWFVGNAYGKAFGFASAGACVAQVILTLGLKAVLVTMDWRFGMRLLAVVSFALLLVAVIITKKAPQYYNLKPNGEMFAKSSGAVAQKEWTLGEAFRTWALWGGILAFATACFSEFLIWSQLVSYWVNDAKLSLATSTNLYAIIGVLGIIFGPLLGGLSDKYASKLGDETKARKILMFVAPVLGLLAMLFLLAGKYSMVFSAIAVILFPMYWMLEPGQVTGYMGSYFGRKSFPKIWGLATLIIMGVGPATGSYLGAKLFVVFGTYTVSFALAAGMFALSAIFALTLSNKAAYKQVTEAQAIERSSTD
jgi:MFS transporter, OFA family, oxalate/formate antiporter